MNDLDPKGRGPGSYATLLGQKIGRLTVMEFVSIDSKGKRMFLCKCECGNEKIVRGAPLKNGHTRSCGCLLSDTSYRHGGKRLPEYSIWTGMIARCSNQDLKAYKWYGGRGISVCEKWRDFGAFIEDMGPRPSPKHSIDRIDNDGNYEPGNCRWATAKVQANNKRQANQFRPLPNARQTQGDAS